MNYTNFYKISRKHEKSDVIQFRDQPRSLGPLSTSRKLLSRSRERTLGTRLFRDHHVRMRIRDPLAPLRVRNSYNEVNRFELLCPT